MASMLFQVWICYSKHGCNKRARKSTGSFSSSPVSNYAIQLFTHFKNSQENASKNITLVSQEPRTTRYVTSCSFNRFKIKLNLIIPRPARGPLLFSILRRNTACLPATPNWAVDVSNHDYPNIVVRFSFLISIFYMLADVQSFSCPSPGLFAYPESCSRYYDCSASNGWWKISVITLLKLYFGYKTLKNDGTTCSCTFT